MTQEDLKLIDISTVHHEVAGISMPQIMESDPMNLTT
jgi:hypothetical protein